MKIPIYVISAILLVILAQNIETKDVLRKIRKVEQKLQEKHALKISERDLRGIRDVWNKIRENAITSWNYIKSMAEKSKERVKLFINNVIHHSVELKDKFESKLNELKDKLNSVISDLYGTGEIVKQCLRDEQENLEEIPKAIMAHMIECTAEKINFLTQFNSDESHLAMNETKFIRELDEKRDMCEHDLSNVQECLCKVREDIFDNFTDMENIILRHHYESRNIADDIKGTIVTCFLNNLMEATNSIAAEILEIAKCVLEAKEKEQTPLE